jgi:hypothetical protein
MIYLIIPDTHLKHKRAQRIIDNEGADKVILLGDFFDDFNDSVEMNIETAEWVKSKINNDYFIFLNGNHCLQYRYSNNPYTKCSGYSYNKDVAINQILTKQDWDKFKWYYVLDDYLITHAGLSYSHLGNLTNFTIPEIIKFLDKNIVNANIALEINQAHWLFMAGQYRGGQQKTGGITWVDFDNEFEPIAGIKQLAGHTEKSNIRYLDGKNNICLDTSLNHYAVYNSKTKELKIKEYKSL